MNMEEPTLLQGGVAVDDRGMLSFINDFSFAGVKRFYMVENHAQGFIRAWHAHKIEAKYVTVVSGSALIAAVRVDNWETPSTDTPVQRYVLSAAKPAVVYIPAGYANGAMSLTRDARIMYYSTTTMEESKGDDFRYPARYWNPWDVEER
jgi:dTDP-4-dehydrorhamnose 3,5-epimerase-like enzyme